MLFLELFFASFRTEIVARLTCITAHAKLYNNPSPKAHIPELTDLEQVLLSSLQQLSHCFVV
jgi:hypothetical protein